MAGGGLRGGHPVLGDRIVRKMLPFLACLMLILTTWAGMAHAAEARNVETSVVGMTGHAAGDGDEVPADADTGYPHHHASCHEHNVNTPAVCDVPLIDAHHRSAPLASTGPALAGHLPDRTLRPPQA